MKLVSWNVNGVRAACTKGAIESLLALDADVICLQEVRIAEEALPAVLGPLSSQYRLFIRTGSRSGYAGVALLARRSVVSCNRVLGLERFDGEGRMVEVELAGGLRVLNVYMPHGGRQQEHLAYKLACYDRLLAKMSELSDTPTVLLGDLNIAYAEIDLARPKQNRKNTMFTPAERDKLKRFTALGWADSFRTLHDDEGKYSWWPWLASARARNVGWRIDYAFVSPPLRQRIKSAFILDDVRGSDHCPVGLELKIGREPSAGPRGKSKRLPRR